MITEDYVNFETAKLLKEKGFDEPCECAYTENGQYLLSCYKGIAGRRIKNSESLNFSYSVVSPTLQMAMKWLRKVHKWHIEISRGEYGYFVHIVSAKNLSTENYAVRIEGGYNLSYEEACEAGIRYCLENLI